MRRTYLNPQVKDRHDRSNIRSIGSAAPRKDVNARSDKEQLTAYARTHGKLIYNPEVSELDYEQVRGSRDANDFHIGVRRHKGGKIIILLEGKQGEKGPFKVFVISGYNYKGFSNQHTDWAIKNEIEDDTE